MKLNEEQTLAVQHPQGAPAVLIAGAGSGKTRVLTERVRWLMDQGVAAAPYLRHHIHQQGSRRTQRTPRHSYRSRLRTKNPASAPFTRSALGGIRKNPQAFGLADKVTPLDEYDQSATHAKGDRRMGCKEQDTILKESDKGFLYALLDKIGFHRARGIGFRNEYTDTVHERAMEEHGGYHALARESNLKCGKRLRKRSAATRSWISMTCFTLLCAACEPIRSGRLPCQKQFDHMLMDEAQDTNPVQWEFVNGLLGSRQQESVRRRRHESVDLWIQRRGARHPEELQRELALSMSSDVSHRSQPPQP